MPATVWFPAATPQGGKVRDLLGVETGDVADRATQVAAGGRHDEELVR